MLHVSSRRWRILPVAVLVTIGCLAFAAVALAWTNDQIANRINTVESNGGGHVKILSRSGSASSGYVDITDCSSTFNTGSTTYYYAYEFLFRFRNVHYFTDSAGHLQVNMNTDDPSPPRCNA